ncbi:MAG TPA: hypothetical protein V6D47_09785 [Oscillatoriaceae cyanobacterium]
MRRAIVFSVMLALALGARAQAVPMVDDNLPSFLGTVGQGSGEAWVAYEAAHSRTLDQLFYRDRSPAQKLALVREGLADWVPVARVREFEAHWQSDYDAVASRMVALLGQTPDLTVSVWYSLDTRVAVSGTVDGRPTLGINARLMLPYDSANTRLTFARAMYQYFAQQADPDPEASSLARQMQVEGLVLAASERLVPGLPAYRYLQVSESAYKQFQRFQPAIARAMEAALDGPDSANAMRRFFGAGYGDPWPAGAGRFVAYEAARATIQGNNPLDYYTVPSQDYLFQVRPALDALARVDAHP